MDAFTPIIPISLQIRKIIFENYNDVDEKFTNDEIFEKIKQNGDLDPSWIIDDIESYFMDLCNSGLARNIAQNFTTIWMKLFEPMKKQRCNTCNLDVYLGMNEKQICPNPLCKSFI